MTAFIFTTASFYILVSDESNHSLITWPYTGQMIRTSSLQRTGVSLNLLFRGLNTNESYVVFAAGSLLASRRHCKASFECWYSVPAKRACFHCKWVLLLFRHPHLELYSRESLQLSSRCFLPGVSSPWRKNGSWESFWFSELLQVEVWHRFFCLQLLIGKCIQLALGIVTGCDVLKSPHFTDFQVFKVSKSLPRSIVS